jgi:hypothetical protein
VEVLPVLQTVSSIEIITFWNKDIELCESNSGYLWSFIVYIKKETVLESSLILKDTLKKNSTSSEILCTPVPQRLYVMAW